MKSLKLLYCKGLLVMYEWLLPQLRANPYVPYETYKQCADAIDDLREYCTRK
jgi:hypothetical protein